MFAWALRLAISFWRAVLSDCAKTHPANNNCANIARLLMAAILLLQNIWCCRGRNWVRFLGWRQRRRALNSRTRHVYDADQGARQSRHTNVSQFGIADVRQADAFGAIARNIREGEAFQRLPRMNPGDVGHLRTIVQPDVRKPEVPD